MDNLDGIITILDSEGNEREGEILFTFEANGDDVILYELDDLVYAARINDDNSLSPIEDDEWKLIEKIYLEYQEDMELEDE